MTHPTPNKATRQETDMGGAARRDGWGDDLSAEAISIAREQFKEACGVETAFFDDVSKMMAILASRAILAGLHSDIKDDDTRARMEAAAEKLRTVHERNLGYAITAHKPSSPGDEAA